MSFHNYRLAACAAAMLVSSPVDAEIVWPLGDSEAARLSFFAEGSLAYENRPAFTTLPGGTDDGYERLRLQSTVRLQYAYANIGDPLWSEVNLTGTVEGIHPLGNDPATLDVDLIHKNDDSFGGLNVTVGSGGYYGFVSNGAASSQGPGAGHFGGHPYATAQTGLFDTFQRVHGDLGNSGDMFSAYDLIGVLDFISEDLGGSNEEVFLGFGYVNDNQHYNFQTSANGEWVALSFGQKITSTVGVNGVVYAVDSTNINGRDVDDYGYDLIVGYRKGPLEYGARLTGFGLGSSPVWNGKDRTRLRLSSSYAITDRHAVGFNFDYEDLQIIQPTTGAYLRDATTRRLIVMYGYHLNDNAFLTVQGNFTELKSTSGSLAGNKQSISEMRLAYNFAF